MKKKFLVPALVAFILLGMFIALSIISKVYKGGDVPIQVMGAFLGAIITAFITMLLLLGQSEAEELKERNVRVFEEKTNRYNMFIEELWKIWEDRRVTLEELNELLKSVSKDILLYTNKTTVDKILDSLNIIAKYADKDPSNEDEKKQIQHEVFQIINLLAKELNLGGEITPGMETKLNSLEMKILPLLNAKIYKPLFLEEINRRLKDSNLPLYDAYYKYWVDGDYIFINIENTPVKVIAGPVSRSQDLTNIIGFYVDYYEYPKFYDYKDATKGWRKDILKGFWKDTMKLVDFTKPETMGSFIDQFKSSNKGTNPTDILVLKIIEFYNQWRFAGKNLEQITKECS